jgi:hypothetical protein
MPTLISHSITGWISLHTTSIAQIPLRTYQKTLRGHMTEKIQCSLYGEIMAVRCNSKTKHTSNIIELSYGYSENHDNAKCPSEQTLTLCCSADSCLHLLSCRQNPTTFEMDRQTALRNRRLCSVLNCFFFIIVWFTHNTPGSSGNRDTKPRHVPRRVSTFLCWITFTAEVTYCSAYLG